MAAPAGLSLDRHIVPVGRKGRSRSRAAGHPCRAARVATRAADRGRARRAPAPPDRAARRARARRSAPAGVRRGDRGGPAHHRDDLLHCRRGRVALVAGRSAGVIARHGPGRSAPPAASSIAGTVMGSPPNRTADRARCAASAPACRERHHRDEIPLPLGPGEASVDGG